ncbi:MAG: hypothetical protein IPL83_00790 [Bdellovibrionales bacterium]|nr:hypothetical protein [Bdellovibrionales bacterium]
MMYSKKKSLQTRRPGMQASGLDLAQKLGDGILLPEGACFLTEAIVPRVGGNDRRSEVNPDGKMEKSDNVRKRASPQGNIYKWTSS